MADTSKTPQGPQKKQHNQGSKDSKLTKRNKNVSTALPDREKEAREVADVSKRMGDMTEIVFEPWQKQVIELQLQGWPFEAIIKRGEEARAAIRAGNRERKHTRWARIPCRQLFFEALKQQPGYKEACVYAFNFAVEGLAQEAVVVTRELDQVKYADGKPLAGRDLVEAKYKRILASMNIAERRLSGWQRDQQGETEVIVFEPYGGWVPTNTGRLADGRIIGQGPEGESAAERWKKMREEAKDA